MQYNTYIDWDRNHPIKKRTRRWAYIGAIGLCLVLISLTVGLSGMAVHYWAHRADTGVKACRQMADNVKTGDTQNDNNTPMTEAQYQKALKPWNDSRYADLRVAGSNVVTTIYQVSNSSSLSENDADLANVMAILSTLQTQWIALQTACANHRVTVPPLPTA